MYKYFIAATLALTTLFSKGYSQQNTELPTTTVLDLKGKKHDFNTIFEPGKVTLVSIWATWCMPCIKEIKNINSNLKQWQAETPELNYVIISIDDARASAQVKSMVNTQKW